MMTVSEPQCHMAGGLDPRICDRCGAQCGATAQGAGLSSSHAAKQTRQHRRQAHARAARLCLGCTGMPFAWLLGILGQKPYQLGEEEHLGWVSLRGAEASRFRALPEPVRRAALALMGELRDKPKYQWLRRVASSF